MTENEESEENETDTERLKIEETVEISRWYVRKFKTLAAVKEISKIWQRIKYRNIFSSPLELKYE